MNRVELTVLRGKILGLENMFMAGALEAADAREEAAELLKTPDIPPEEKARLEVLAKAGLGDQSARPM